MVKVITMKSLKAKFFWKIYNKFSIRKFIDQKSYQCITLKLLFRNRQLIGCGYLKRNGLTFLDFFLPGKNETTMIR